MSNGVGRDGHIASPSCMANWCVNRGQDWILPAVQLVRYQGQVEWSFRVSALCMGDVQCHT